MKKLLLIFGACLLMAGCASVYSWRSKVPEEMRSVAVSTFRNESSMPELGAVAARQVLREFQREGTFKIGRVGETAVEIQGVVKSCTAGALTTSRRSTVNLSACELTAVFEVSIIDKSSEKVLVDNRLYTARATFTSTQDITTASRDALGRVSEDLARQVVDDVLNLKW